QLAAFLLGLTLLGAQRLDLGLALLLVHQREGGLQLDVRHDRVATRFFEVVRLPFLARAVSELFGAGHQIGRLLARLLEVGGLAKQIVRLELARLGRRRARRDRGRQQRERDTGRGHPGWHPGCIPDRLREGHGVLPLSAVFAPALSGAFSTVLSGVFSGAFSLALPPVFSLPSIAFFFLTVSASAFCV